MPANTYALLPALAAILFIGFGLAATDLSGKAKPADWRFPAALSALLAAWSVYTVWAEGPLGFLPNHTANAWGNQVWFDLLLAVGIGWALLLPRIRHVGMQPLVWLALIATTGSIGLLATLARYQYLETRQPSA